jgi:hypothetical protein
VVVVAGDVDVGAVVDAAGLAAEAVPDGGALAVLEGALDLRGAVAAPHWKSGGRPARWAASSLGSKSFMRGNRATGTKGISLDRAGSHAGDQLAGAEEVDDEQGQQRQRAPSIRAPHSVLLGL